MSIPILVVYSQQWKGFYIEQRVEKAKEFLSCGQKTLSEISFELGHGHTVYLSTQFKKITGITPTEFKEAGIARRKAPNKS